MPEAPEVYVVSRQLREFIGKKLVIKSRLDKYSKFANSKHLPAKLLDVKVRGKLLVFCFSDIYLSVHFMLTGHFYKEEGNNTRAIFYFDDVPLYLDDARNFAKLEWLTKDMLKEKLNKLGPSIVNVKSDRFVSEMQTMPNKNIGTALHEQSKISGMGNYMRAEILYKVKIKPQTLIKDLNKSQLISIYNAAKNLTKKVINLGGTEDYMDINGKYGEYKFRVYGKKQDPKGNPVTTFKAGSQNIYYSSIQK